MSKPPKAILKEELDKRVKLNPSWVWSKPEELGMGMFRVKCAFRKELNARAIEGTGEGLGIKAAEHKAAEKILDDLGDPYKPFMSSPGKTVNKSPGSSIGNTGKANIQIEGIEQRAEPLDNEQVLQEATNGSRNFVGHLKEYCEGNGIAAPDYEENFWVDENGIRTYKTTCQVNQFVSSGVAKKRKDSKKIAAMKVYRTFVVTSSPVEALERINAPVNHYVIPNDVTPPKDVAVEEVIAAVEEIELPATSEPSASPYPLELILPEATGKAVMISNKVGYYPSIVLGRGGYAKVYRGFLERPERKMAIKQATKEDVEDPKCKELEILEISHENLVRYYITEEYKGHVYFVMDLAHSTLEEWVKKASKPHEYEILIKVCKDAATGLKELHRKNIIHRDIKPSNVLIFEEVNTAGIIPKAKLSDFGISRFMDRRPDGVTTQVGNKGTVTYMPPEVHTTPPNESFDLQPSFDIFALGIVFAFTMTEGQHLFAWEGKLIPVFIQANIAELKVNWNLLYDPKFTALRNLLQVMLSGIPKDRSSMRVILEHPFFFNYRENFDFILAASNDIKNNGGDWNQIQSSHNQFRAVYPIIPDNWTDRLDKEIQGWIKGKDKKLEGLGRTGNPVRDGWKKYKGLSIVQLINFIRDQDQHYANWKSNPDLEKPSVFGQGRNRYGAYFSTRFPELSTLLYVIFQDPKFKGKHTNQFYKHNSGITHKLTWCGSA